MVSPAADSDSALVIHNATVVDGTDADPLTKGVVVVEGNRIAAVGSESAVRVPRGARTYDADGGTVIPGMINLHDHIARKGLRQPSTTRWCGGRWPGRRRGSAGWRSPPA